MLIHDNINQNNLVGSHFAAHTLGAMKNTIKTVKINTIPFFFLIKLY